MGPPHHAASNPPLWLQDPALSRVREDLPRPEVCRVPSLPQVPGEPLTASDRLYWIRNAHFLRAMGPSQFELMQDIARDWPDRPADLPDQAFTFISDSPVEEKGMGGHKLYHQTKRIYTCSICGVLGRNAATHHSHPEEHYHV